MAPSKKNNQPKKGAAKKPATDQKPFIKAGGDDSILTQTNQEGFYDTLNTDPDVKLKDIGKTIVGDIHKLSEAIPAASHAPETINIDGQQPLDNVTPGSSANTSSSYQQGPAAPQQEPTRNNETFNQEFTDMDPDDQEKSAEGMADLMLAAYVGLKLKAGWLGTISKKRLQKLHDAGEINMYQKVRVSRESDEVKTIEQIVDEFNEKSTQPFVTTQDFIDKVRPLIIIILKRKGLGATVEQQLLYFFGIDILNVFYGIYINHQDKKSFEQTLRDMNIPQAPPRPSPEQQPNQQQQQNNGSTGNGSVAQPVAADIVASIIEKSKETEGSKQDDTKQN